MDIEILGIAPELASGLDQWESKLEADTPLGECLRQLGDEALNRGLIIKILELDDELLSAERRHELAEAPVGSLGLLKVLLEDLGSFLEGTFSECFNSVSNLRKLHEEILRETEDDDLAGAVEPLTSFFAGLSVILGAYRNGLSLLVPCGLAAGVDLEAIQSRLGQIEEVLGDVKEGLIARDSIPLADAFRYEFSDHLDWLAEEFSSWSSRLSLEASSGA